MITRKQFCEMKIQEFCERNSIARHQLKEEDAFESSTLGVCMEYLGLIQNPELKEYVSTRGGILFTYIGFDKNDSAIMSVRELLELLPEEI